MTHVKTQPRDFTTGFNRVMYCLMVLLSIYHLAFSGDVASAMSTLGIALIFDPFSHEVSWAQRPRYQKAILLAHVSAVFTLLGMLMFHFFTH